MQSSPPPTHTNRVLLTGIRLWQNIIDRTTLSPMVRWICLALLLGYSLYRIFKYHCLTVICILVFYIIYLTLQFFTPAGLVASLSTSEENHLEESELILGQPKQDRPLLRVLNEFSLWRKMLGLTLLSLLCTTFELFTLPIYKPFLIGYLIWLVLLALSKHHNLTKIMGFTPADFLSPKPLAPGFQPPDSFKSDK